MSGKYKGVFINDKSERPPVIDKGKVIDVSTGEVINAEINDGIDFDKLPFKVAKTMPNIPHSYVVRNSMNNDEYVKLYKAIIEKGRVGYFYKTRRIYYYRGDGYKYWYMASRVCSSGIINRADENISYG